MPRGSCKGCSSTCSGAVARGEKAGESSGLPKALASWAPARAFCRPLSERSEVLVIPTKPSPFQTRTVIELRWAAFICLASPRSTCTELSLLLAAPRSQRPMAWAWAKVSIRLLRAGASSLSMLSVLRR